MTFAHPFSLRVIRCILLVITAVTVHAPRVHAQGMAYAASLTDLDSTTQAALTKEIARAHDRGLPVEPLMAKVREGRLKRAPGLRIRAAVERLAERLGAARDALGAASSAEEVTAGADAIAAGAQAASLRNIRAATTQSVSASVGALAQLLASGVPESKALDMVLGLLRRNASPAMLVALGNQVEADVATGLSPSASAAFRLRAMEGVLNGTVATDAAFGNLSNAATAPNNKPGSAPRRKP